MKWRDEITLISTTKTVDNDGFNIVAETTQNVFANVKSTSRAEFYEATKAGLRIDVVVEIWADDYAGQRILTYNNKRYEVIRTYRRNDGEMIEISCSEVER